MEQWEQDLVDWMKEKHPEVQLKKQGDVLDLGTISNTHLQEYTKAKNPDAIFEIDGKSMEELIDILDRNRDWLRKTPGYMGSGIDKDGIYINTADGQGIFPDNLEGAKVHFKPARQAKMLGI
jgi:hypothetical protein